MLKTKRAYEPAETSDGTRFLVDRLWPRGIKKEKLKLNVWLKDVAPSTELRKWFAHDPAKWREFRKRYFEELKQNPEAWEPLVTAAKKGSITLIFSSHDQEHNNAAALKQFLDHKMR